MEGAETLRVQEWTLSEIDLEGREERGAEEGSRSSSSDLGAVWRLRDRRRRQGCVFQRITVFFSILIS